MKREQILSCCIFQQRCMYDRAEHDWAKQIPPWKPQTQTGSVLTANPAWPLQSQRGGSAFAPIQDCGERLLTTPFIIRKHCSFSATRQTTEQTFLCFCCHQECVLSCRSWAKWHSICYFLSCSWQGRAGPAAGRKKRASSALAGRSHAALGVRQVSVGLRGPRGCATHMFARLSACSNRSNKLVWQSGLIFMSESTQQSCSLSMDLQFWSIDLLNICISTRNTSSFLKLTHFLTIWIEFDALMLLKL